MPFGLVPEEIYVALIPITSGLFQMLKSLDSTEKYNRFYPLLTELLGFGLGVAAGLNWLFALTIGLSAMGLYRGLKVTVKGE